MAAWHSIMRHGEVYGAIDPRKRLAEEMVADIMTKVTAGALFKRHRATIQGLLYLLPRDDWSVEFVGAELAAAILEK